MFQTWCFSLFPNIFLQFLSLYCFRWKILVLHSVMGTRIADVNFHVFGFLECGLALTYIFSTETNIYFIHKHLHKNRNAYIFKVVCILAIYIIYLKSWFPLKNHSKSRLPLWYTLVSLCHIYRIYITFHNWKCLAWPSYFSIFYFHCLLFDLINSNQKGRGNTVCAKGNKVL